MKKISVTLVLAMFISCFANFTVLAENNYPVPPSLVAPTIYNIRINGKPVVGEVLDLTYDISDPGNTMGISRINWWSQKTEFGPLGNIIKAGTQKLEVTEDLLGSYIRVSIEAKNNDDKTQNPSSYGSVTIGPVISAEPQEASATNVHIFGENKANKNKFITGAAPGSVLTGRFTKMGSESDDDFTYQWYTSNSIDQNAKRTAIGGAVSDRYAVRQEDEGKYISFGVTPKGGSEVISFGKALAGSVSFGAVTSHQAAKPGAGSVYGYNWRQLCTSVNMGMRDFDKTAYVNEFVQPYVIAYPDALLLETDLGEVKEVDGFNMYTLAIWPSRYKLQYSEDRANWTDVKITSTSGRPEPEAPLDELLSEQDLGEGKMIHADFEPFEARYIRLFHSSTASTQSAYIGELEYTGRNVENAGRLSAITADLREALFIPVGTDDNSVYSYLSENVLIKAISGDGSEQIIDFGEVTYDCDTSVIGKGKITISYAGESIVLPVEIGTKKIVSAEAVRNDESYNIILSEGQTITDEIKNEILSNYTVTVTYGDGTEEVIEDNSRLELIIDTKTAGKKQGIIKCGTQEIPIDVFVKAQTEPAVYNMKITGEPVVGEKLVFEYVLNDPDGLISNEASSIIWQSQSSPYFERGAGTIINGAGGKKELLVTEDLTDKYISVNFKIKGINGRDENRTIGVGPVLAQKPETPTASTVSTGTKNLSGSDYNDTLVADYNYTGKNAEGKTKYQWYISDEETGNYTKIDKAQERTYTPSISQYKKYIKAGVTPVDTNGNEGKEELSQNAVAVGNIAYNSFVRSSITAAYATCSLSSVVNGINDYKKGGSVFTYGNGGEDKRELILDFGSLKSVDSLSLISNATGDKVTVYYMDEAGTWIEGVKDLSLGYNTSDICLKVKTSSIKIEYKTIRNVQISEVLVYSALDFPPEITLEGGETVEILKNSSYQEPGFTASDKEDGDISSKVEVSGKVDTAVKGEYEISYKVTDSKPQTTEVIRRVIVKDSLPQKGDLLYNGKIISASEQEKEAQKLIDGNEFTTYKPLNDAEVVIDTGKISRLSAFRIVAKDKSGMNINVSFSEDNKSYTKAYGVTSLYTELENPVDARYVKLEISGTKKEIGSFEVYYSNIGVIKDNIDKIKIPEVTEKDLALANKSGDIEITWKSSDTDVLSDTGVVHRGNRDINVRLTATFSLGNDKIEKTFNVLVKKKKENSKGGSSGGGGYSGGGSNQGYIKAPDNKENSKTEPPAKEVTYGMFKDVPNDFWAKKYIESLAVKNIINGRGENTFEPQEKITRAEFIKLLCTALNFPMKYSPMTQFDDVAEKDWFYPYIAVFHENRLANGKENNKFAPDDFITREEMSALTINALEFAGILTGDVSDISFADKAEISGYAVKSVAKMENEGLIKGYEDGTFRPKNNTTRAEAAKIIFGVMEKNAQGNIAD